MDALVEQAREFAATKHHGRTRRYSKEPYLTHLDRVVAILQEHGFDHPVMLAAAFLHDTIEKTPTTYQELINKFGPEVTELVFWMTDVEEGKEQEKNLLSCWRLARAPIAAKLIKLADVLDNIPHVMSYDRKKGEKFREEKRQVVEAMGEFEGKGLTDMLLYTAALKAATPSN